ncbi:immunodominant virion protein [Turkeypox virus]|uniref:Immunodominant virion protein n=1 Tax=Turkeypox virus TaxID=336486 RepID=A0A0M3ZRQ9_9POXV|nr:immunodominant virion protein [Turkeypox virus]ALA62497.1 immunodominant virion protein [Turkeypox virus]
MADSFYSEFIKNIKLPSEEKSDIFLDNNESAPIESSETIVEEEYSVGDSRSRPSQNKLISLLKNESNGIFDEFVNNITQRRDNTQQPIQDIQETQQAPSLDPKNQQSNELATKPNTMLPIGISRQIPDDSPQWIKDIHSKYSDKLPSITESVNPIDRIAREMFFDEVILWVKYALKENNIDFPHELRELKDVIIP